MRVRDLVQAQPVGGVDLVGANQLAKAFAEDLGAAAVDVVEAGVLELREDVVVRKPVPPGEIVDLGRRKQGKLHVRQRFFETPHQGKPVVERELTRIVTADDMQLVEIRSRFQGLGEHLVSRHPNGAVAFLVFIGGERAKAATGVADVGRIDVAVENVEDVLAALALLGTLGHAPQRVQVAGAQKRNAVFP